MKDNLFIALEGIDGSGKSTQAKLLAEKLKSAGHKVYITFEPTDGQVGKLLRSILKGSVKADNRTIAGLFLADRLDHLLDEHNGIAGKLTDGWTVITDRYYFSSYAYHGVHMDMDWVIDSNKICAEIAKPDINIFIDIPPEIAMERITANRADVELYENLENLKNVREKYLAAFDKEMHRENIRMVEGDRSLTTIAEDIWQEVSQLLQRRKQPVG
jgi:dTMP kinase